MQNPMQNLHRRKVVLIYQSDQIKFCQHITAGCQWDTNLTTGRTTRKVGLGTRRHGDEETRDKNLGKQLGVEGAEHMTLFMITAAVLRNLQDPGELSQMLIHFFGYSKLP